MQISVRGVPSLYRRAYVTTGSAAPPTARHTNAHRCTLTTVTGINAEEKCFASIDWLDLALYEWVTMWDSITLQLLDIGKDLINLHRW